MNLIESIRRHSEAWYAKVFLGILAVCFVVLWGAGDVLQRAWTGGSQSLATVGSSKIDLRTFYQELQKDLNQIQLITRQEIKPEEAKSMGLYGQTLRKLIDNRLLDMECDRLGLVISDETVRHFIHNSPLFADKDGAFDKERLAQFLQVTGQTEKRYVEEARENIRRSQLVSSLSGGIVVPKDIVEPLYKWFFETREIEVALVDANSIKEVPTPTDADLTEFYDAHTETFSLPEYRSFEILVYTDTAIEKNIPAPTDADIQNTFEEGKDSTYQGKPLKDVKSQIIKDIKVLEKEKFMETFRTSIDDMIGAGKTLKEIAQEKGLSLLSFESVAIDGKTKEGAAKLPDHAARQKMIEEAFRIEQGDTSVTIDAEDGVHFIIHMQTITPERVQSLEEVKKEVAEKWTFVKRLEKSAEEAKSISDSYNSGDLVAYKHLAIKKATVERQSDKKSQDIGIPPNMNPMIFSTEIGKATILPSTGMAGTLIVRVVHATPPKEAKSDDKLSDFKKRLEEAYQQDFLEQYMSSLRQRYRVEVNEAVYKKL